MDFKHIILTRFNLATPGREASFRNQQGWLSDRFDLFERFCLPSLAAQTDQNFEWVIYFDELTPPGTRDRIKKCQMVRPFYAFFTPLFDSKGWINSVASLGLLPETGALLTTVLDNDDSLAVDYIERLHLAVAEHEGALPVAFNFSRGLVLHGPDVYQLTHPSSAFVNLLEQSSPNARTAQDIPHMAIREFVPVHQLAGSPAWLQVVHGHNVSNRPRGVLSHSSVLGSLFPESATCDVRNPSPPQILKDRLIAGPIRVARDAVSVNAQRLLRLLRSKDRSA